MEGTAPQGQPMSVQQATQMAEQLHQAGKLREANAIYLQILAIDPKNYYVVNLLGMVAAQVGNLPIALQIYNDLVKLAPNFAEGHSNRGNVLQDMGDFVAAAESYRRAVELQPAFAQAHYNLGNVAARLGQDRDAVAHFRTALTLQPDAHQVLNNLGTALRRLGEYQQALQYLQQLCALQPQNVEALNNLANTLGELGDYPLAIETLRRALQLQPDAALTHYNLGATLAKQGLFVDAVSSYRQAMTCDPNHVEAKWNCALAYLMLGDYAQGWPLHEFRLHKTSAHLIPLDKPRWQGESLSGKTILVHAEQGFGDTLQFARFLPMLVRKYDAQEVILECQPELTRLLANVQGVTKIVAGGMEALPPFDVHIPLLSLPLIFETRLGNIPADVPYIAAPLQAIQQWQSRLAAETRPKIGLVWAGNPNNAIDARRSFHAHVLVPLLAIPDICFISLQKATSDKARSSELRLINWTDELMDFVDTAALIAQLDLVISTDTAVAHLAGAMGKPVWLLNSFESEWRWMLEQSDCAWYPSMRIFRQPKPGDWETVIRQVAAELALLA
ncbi:MAG: tetratricopeptide repeat protein [Burkholderiaceae bacterium]